MRISKSEKLLPEHERPASTVKKQKKEERQKDTSNGKEQLHSKVVRAMKKVRSKET